MIGCERTRALLSLYVLGDLKPDAAAAAAEHVASCADCRQEYDRIQATVALLRDALAETREASPRLAADRRRQILATTPAGRTTRRPVVRKRELWFVRHHHGLAVAAGLLVVFGLLWSIMLPTASMSGRTAKVSATRARELADATDHAMWKLDGYDALDRTEERRGHQITVDTLSVSDDVPEPPHDIGGFAYRSATPVTPPEAVTCEWGSGDEPIEGTVHRRGPGQAAAWTTESWAPLGLSSGKSDDTDNRDSDGDGLTDATLAAPDTSFQPAPATFDGVAGVKSPVIMRSIRGSRSPGARGYAKYDQTAGGGKGQDKDPIVDTDLDESKVAGGYALDVNGTRIANAQAQQQAEAAPPDEVPLLGDLPVNGRLFADARRRDFSGAVGGDDNSYMADVADPSELKDAPPPLSKHKPDAPATGPVVFHRYLPASGERDVEHKVSQKNTGSGDGWKYEPAPGGDLKLTIVDAEREGQNQAIVRGNRSERDVVSSRATQATFNFAQAAERVKSPPPERWKELRCEDEEKLTSCLENPDREKQAVLKKQFDTIITTTPPPAPPKPSRSPDGEKEAGDELRERPRVQAYGVNPFKQTAVDPLSTFSIDVDTASYTMARTYMHRGNLPPPELVRTEEFVNAFDYAYRAPTRETFRIYTEMAPSPFGPGLHLLKIGVKGRRLGREEERPAVLTLVIDTSGSMNQPDRLELVQAAVHLLVEQLSPRDRVAVIQYDSHARIALEHTSAARKADILGVIDGLQCHGSTNLEEAMHQAYALAVRAFVPGAENRVILMSDGVANMGTDSAEAILSKVEANRRQGITCSVMGFGIGSYDDVMLESLANKGDGAYSFIDSLDQARRVFVDDLAATLNTIARDVKIQVRFNPATVAQHRQLGYENRQLAHRDFRNDAVDAGEVGSGQSVTALYECALPPAVQAPVDRADADAPLATVFVRYRRVDTGAVEEIEHILRRRDVHADFRELPAEFRLAAGVAEFAEILRGSPFARGSDFEAVAGLLRPVALELHLDTRVQELLRLVHGAGSLTTAE